MNHYNIDRLRESMVKILGSDGQPVAGSGFIIRSDGYLITCHHVIYLLDALNVEYQGQIYAADWCEKLSNPEVDIAILKIDIENAKAVPIINPQHLSTSVTVYGFPPSQKKFFPEGIAVSAQSIRRSSPLNTVSTYRSREIKATNPWNKLPQDESTFLSHRIDTKVDSGTSGGAVFAEDLGGVVGVIQCSKSDESYVIRWDNIIDFLDKLGLVPEKNAVCRFLQDIEDKFKTIRFFHTKEKKINLKEQYIPIQVTLEMKRKDEEFFLGYAESKEEVKRLYALKGSPEEAQQRKEKEIKQVIVDWKEAKNEYLNQNLMVLADPGMGKSTLLMMEAGTTAKQEREKLRPLPNPPLPGEGVRQLPPASGGLRGVEDVIFPLFLRLSELAEIGEEIINAIPIVIQREYPKTYPGIEHLLEDKLSNGKCFLLLDALDEVPKEYRNRLKERLNRFTQNYACSIICTSRIVGYGGAFAEGAKEVEIVPFNQKQTEEYIEIWFKNAAGYIEDDSISAEGLIQELRNKPQIGGLAQNPLLLSLLCSLYQEKGLMLPARRTQVYEKAVDYMLSKWSVNRKPQSPGKIEAKIWLLEKLAYDFSCDDEKDGIEIFGFDELHRVIEEYFKGNQVPVDLKNSTPSALIEELSEEDGILQKWDRDGNKYLFLHRTFQEYLTAAYLNRTIKGNQNQGISLVKKLFWEYDSHESLILLAGLMKNPVLLLQALTEAEDDIFKTLLLLAGRCLAECQEYGKSLLESTHPLIAKIIQRIYKLWRRYPDANFIQSTVVVLGQVNAQMCQKLQAAFHDSDRGLRRHAAEALGQIGNDQAVQELTAALNHSDLILRWEVAEALVRIGNAQAVPGLISVLNHSDFWVTRGVVEALGRIGNAQAVSGLMAALNHSDPWVRRKVAEVLGKIGNAQAVPGLIAALNHSDPWVRREAAEFLGKIGNAQAVPGLIAALNDLDSDVRKEVVEALRRIGNAQAVQGLIAALNHSDWDVRWWAAVVLGRIGSPQAVPGLIAALNDLDSDVRKEVVEALRRIGNAQAVQGLIAALNHSDPWVRRQAAEVLGRIGSPQAVRGLIAALNHSYQVAFKHINLSFSYLGVLCAWSGLLNPMLDCNSVSDSDVRWWAAGALGRMGNPLAMPGLMAALNHSSPWVRREAAEALGQMGNAQAVQGLIATLNHSDSEVRRQAAEVLVKISNAQAVQGLIATLNDSSSSVRVQAAEALGRISNPRAVDTLIAALNHSDSSVRVQAAEALGRIGNARAVDALIAALNHLDSEVRIQAALGLGEMGYARAVDALIAALNHLDSKVRIQAAKALVKIGNARAVDALIAALNHLDSEVRIQAAKALVKIGNARAVDALIAALNHLDSEVRIQAAKALVKIGNARAVDALIAALNHLDSEVRIQAAKALVKIGNARAVDALIAALNHLDSDVSKQAAEALGKIGNAQTLKNLIEFWDIDIYHPDIFPLARTLAIRFSKAKHSFIPVYPKLVAFKYSPILATGKRCGQTVRFAVKTIGRAIASLTVFAHSYAGQRQL